ncbi:MAG: tetratricopeptide repeat protein [Alphaproteobacteria bacterium]|nr:tetratricopeptide repeat protein [Alphaproteobacteria bacterium]
MAFGRSGLDITAGMGAGEAVLARIETSEEEATAAADRLKSADLVRRAIKLWRRGEVVRAAQLALRATEADPNHGAAFHMLALALEKMGHLHKALVTYERAFALDPEDADLLLNLGLTAWGLKMHAAAADMFRQYIEKRPDSPLGYNNLGSVLCDLGDANTAIEILRTAIYRMPQEAVLWNSLATVLSEQGRAEEALIFYKEAIALDPGYSRPWHNLAFALSHLGRLEESLEAYDEALARAVDLVDLREGRHSRSICLIGMGRLDEGFREYEIRNDPSFRSYVRYMVDAPTWQGEALDGKRLLVIGEQGLGDEIMFASVLPDLYRAVGRRGQLMIAVDPRLVSLVQRSFPKAIVGGYEDRRFVDGEDRKEFRYIPFATADQRPDYYIPMASALQFTRTRIEDFPKASFLTPEPARVAQLRARLLSLGTGPFVGICWRSMLQDVKRNKYFSALEQWVPILRTQGVEFVNLQYGACEDELTEVCARHKVTVHRLQGLDLKSDIDGAAALSAALDLVISAPTAAAATAASVGTETWILTAGRTWPQLGTPCYPWYRAAPVFHPRNFADWDQLLPEVAAALSGFAARLSAA